MQALIAAKRDGRRHSEVDLQNLATAAANGTVPDYQLSAWLMAVYLNGLDADETAWLTMAMAESGQRLDLEGLPKPWLDKHSTGGVGDKTTLVVLPLLAACGVRIVKMSGRGLGITGGTVDKLSSVPGFRLDLTPEELKQQAMAVGVALTGQTPNLAPADKVLYALRDATGTVRSLPLIVSSILSKKIAGGADTVVLDVKCGSGAFMRNLAEASELASALMDIGTRCGLRVKAAITDMEQPLGSSVGNALEVREALEVLQGGNLSTPTARFRELCLALANHSLWAWGAAGSEEEANRLATEALSSGRAYQKAVEWFAAQGASADLSQLPVAPVIQEVRSTADGYVQEIDAQAVGQAVLELGGGRQKKEDAIDVSVGIVSNVCVGSSVRKGDVLFSVHAATEEEASQAARSVMNGIQIGSEPTPTPSLILKLL